MDSRECDGENTSNNALVCTVGDTTRIEDEARCRPDVYHLHIEVHRDYERLCKRNRPNIISNISKENYRLQGSKNIDLWVDGKLYPVDPLRKSTPPFIDVTSLLNFVRDGYAGLLGYTLNLQAQHGIIKLERDLMERENINLKNTIEQYAQKLCTTNETILEL